MRRAKNRAATLNGARRTAAKICDTDRFMKVGEITASVARAAGIEPGDIVLAEPLALGGMHFHRLQPNPAI